MAIAEIRVHRVPLAARSSYTMSNSTVSAPRSTVVEVVSDDGTIGHGEACLASEQFQPATTTGFAPHWASSARPSWASIRATSTRSTGRWTAS